MPTEIVQHEACKGCLAHGAEIWRKELLPVLDSDRVAFFRLLDYCLSCGRDVRVDGKRVPCTCGADA